MKQYNSYDYLIKQLKTKNYIQIAKENNVSTKTIQRKLKKFGFTNPSEKWAKQEINLLKKEYSTTFDIYKLFPNRTICAINHKASRLGLKKPNLKRKYKLNSHFFDKWTAEMAYFFGWFCSDGCVSSKDNCCSFHIHIKDAYILKRFKDSIGSNHLVKIRNNNYAQLKIYDPFLYQSLIKLGCKPKKSATLNFPNIPNKFLRHFLRGYFDGDGSIMINKPNTIKMQFSSSKQFAETLQKLLNKKLNLNFNKNKEDGRIWQCSYYGKDARKLCKWMYAGCNNLYLKRKKKIFDNHLKKWVNTYSRS